MKGFKILPQMALSDLENEKEKSKCSIPILILNSTFFDFFKNMV